MANYRSGRINEEIRKEISDIIQNHIKDPRLNAMVSVTKVDVTKDLRYAKVFVSIFGEEAAKKSTYEALKSSAGFIRHEIGQRISLRYIPEVVLELDNTIEHGMKIDALLDKLKEKDKNDHE